MDDEKAATEVLDTPDPIGQEPPATEETPAGQDESSEEPKAPTTWEALEGTEWFPTAFAEKNDALIERTRADLLPEAKRTAYREFEPHILRTAQTLSDLAKTGQNMSRNLRDAIESVGEGGDAKTMQRSIQRVIDDNPGFIELVNNSMYSKGQETALRTLADESGDSNLFSDIYLLLQNDPNMGDRKFARTVLDRLTEARIKDSFISKEASEKALKVKDDEIAKLKAGVNQDKAKTRTEGPEKLPGSAGGGAAADVKRLLDPATPIPEIMEIRARQKAAGE